MYANRLAGLLGRYPIFEWVQNPEDHSPLWPDATPQRGKAATSCCDDEWGTVPEADSRMNRLGSELSPKTLRTSKPARQQGSLSWSALVLDDTNERLPYRSMAGKSGTAADDVEDLRTAAIIWSKLGKVACQLRRQRAVSHARQVLRHKSPEGRHVEGGLRAKTRPTLRQGALGTTALVTCIPPGRA